MASSGTRKADFIEFMLQAGVLKFGEFVTKSGRASPYFLNTGAYRSGRQLDRLAGYYAELIEESFGSRCENLFGPAYKGIPLVTAAAMKLYQIHGRDVTVTFNRKEAKAHGEGGVLVGDQYAETPFKKKVVIVEDVVTAGTSVRETMDMFESFEGVEVVGLVASVDRMEKGRGSKSALTELAEAYQLETKAIVDLQDLIAYLEDSDRAGMPVVEPSQVAAMHEYCRQYGGR